MARRDRAAFVGRKRELAELGRLFVDDPPASVVLLHGPGGIGKGTLLRELERRGREAGWTPVSVEGRDLPPVPDALEAALAPARTAERPLLLVDTYERMTALSGYLRRGLLPSLPDRAVVVIAGRGAPRWRLVRGRLGEARHRAGARAAVAGGGTGAPCRSRPQGPARRRARRLGGGLASGAEPCGRHGRPRRRLVAGGGGGVARAGPHAGAAAGGVRARPAPWRRARRRLHRPRDHRRPAPLDAARRGRRGGARLARAAHLRRAARGRSHAARAGQEDPSGGPAPARARARARAAPAHSGQPPRPGGPGQAAAAHSRSGGPGREPRDPRLLRLGRQRPQPRRRGQDGRRRAGGPAPLEPGRSRLVAAHARLLPRGPRVHRHRPRRRRRAVRLFDLGHPGVRA